MRKPLQRLCASAPPRRWRPAARRLLGLAALGAAAAGLAYNIDGDRWLDGSATLFIGVPGRAIGGQAWVDVLQDTLNEWNTRTSFRFVADRNYRSPCTGYTGTASGNGFPSGNGDGRNGIDFRPNVCGNRFGDTTLAITLSLFNNTSLGFSEIVESDIVFNSEINWDVYDGPRRSGVDFRRTALHELGHVLGLQHEETKPAIMAPRISDLDRLQADDIAGANALYAGPSNCPITELTLDTLVRNSLAQGDCRVLDLFRGGSDTSFVDTYRLRLSQFTRLQFSMRSSQLDSVLVLTDSKLRSLDIFDDSAGSCDASALVTLPAGEYLLLANTYVTPVKCPGNVGQYSLTVTQTAQPVLGDVLNLAAVAPAATLITGGASADGGLTYRRPFAATESFDVLARLGIDPVHVGQAGHLLVLVRLADGSQFAVAAGGRIQPFTGSPAQLPPFRSGPLQALEILDIARGVQGRAAGLAGQQLQVYVGYAPASQPEAVHFGSQPIVVSISP
ncbi:MAG: matrixin family metalloprotease [Pseudohongiellaceae bacterium]